MLDRLQLAHQTLWGGDINGSSSPSKQSQRRTAASPSISFMSIGLLFERPSSIPYFSSCRMKNGLMTTSSPDDGPPVQRPCTEQRKTRLRTVLYVDPVLLQQDLDGRPFLRIPAQARLHARNGVRFDLSLQMLDSLGRRSLPSRLGARRRRDGRRIRRKVNFVRHVGDGLHFLIDG